MVAVGDDALPATLAGWKALSVAERAVPVAVVRSNPGDGKGESAWRQALGKALIGVVLVQATRATVMREAEALAKTGTPLVILRREPGTLAEALGDRASVEELPEVDNLGHAHAARIRAVATWAGRWCDAAATTTTTTTTTKTPTRR